ncbi:MAG TPA: extracellular solute-binding protein [Candidatus Avipropionibacterium avicola]|uniref:Extracellular solute-binding protein n=1 Tax=Candidatus Avipropionibacterium avicola TaxID=2840701 RepID=A0A9D1GVU4_9ACTN|nr:extracellular solute-binding protein [Candidatus Avipropionibacterium avicola]
MLTRRGLLGIGAAGTAALTLGACGDNAGSSGAGGGGGGDPLTGDLRLGWWGNPTRNENTEDAIAAYKEIAPDVTITPEAGDWSSYWDKLGTQVAGRDAPDVIQMDMAYIREYGDRGALLDLSELVDTSKFAEGTADAGQLSDGLFGINCGVNSLTFLANPTLFEKAGMDLPDDASWTWDEMAEIGTELTAKSGGDFHGMPAWSGDDAINLWLRQNQKSFYTEDGFGFEAGDIVPFFTWLKGLLDSKAAPPAAVAVEDGSKSLDQQAFATGKMAIGSYWSNQVKALDAASGEDLVILRLPTHAGNADEGQFWYKASMLWSVSAQTDYPEAAAAVVDFLVNNEAAVKIIKAERGLPPNLEMRELIVGDLDASDKKAADFIDAIAPGISDSPIPPLIGTTAVRTTLENTTNDMMFGKITPEQAATQFYDTAKGQIEVKS